MLTSKTQTEVHFCPFSGKQLLALTSEGAGKKEDRVLKQLRGRKIIDL